MKGVKPDLRITTRKLDPGEEVSAERRSLKENNGGDEELGKRRQSKLARADENKKRLTISKAFEEMKSIVTLIPN